MKTRGEEANGARDCGRDMPGMAIGVRVGNLGVLCWIAEKEGAEASRLWEGRAYSCAK